MNSKNEMNGWARVARWGVAITVFFFGCMVVPEDASDETCAAVVLVAVAVFWAMKLKARKQQERQIDAAELRASIGR